MTIITITMSILGIIVGPSKTYGKGLVQKITPLPFDNALKYTIAKYYTPSGRCIQSVTYTGMAVRTSPLHFVYCIPEILFLFFHFIFISASINTAIVIYLFIVFLWCLCIQHYRRLFSFLISFPIFLSFNWQLLCFSWLCVCVCVGGRDVIEVAMKSANEDKKVTNI